MGDDAVADGHVAHSHLVAVAKFDGAGGRGETAIGDGDVFARLGAPARSVRGIKHNRVVAGLDGAVGDNHVPATVWVDPIRPNSVFLVRVDVDSVDSEAVAVVRVEGPAGRIDDGNSRHTDVFATQQLDRSEE